MSETKTVRVRIAVAVDERGKAVAAGGNIPDKDAERMLEDWGMLEAWESSARLRFCWVEADVPLPEPRVDPVIEGTVSA